MACRKSFTELKRHGRLKRLRKLCGTQHEQTQCTFSSEQCLNDNAPDNIREDQHVDCDSLNTSSDAENVSVVAQNYGHHTMHSMQEILDRLPLSDDSEDDFGTDDMGQEKLVNDLRDWSVQFQITNVAFSALLCILKGHNCFQSLPSDARTILKTPLSVPSRPVDPGLYCHIGIGCSIQRMWSNVTESVSVIELLVGIDGLPLFSSSPGELWPILATVLNVKCLGSKVFPVGVYYGRKKPADSNEFLREFIGEITTLIHDGILLNGSKVLVSLKGFCCDSPAKSFILGVKGHTGYSSCTRCTQEGIFYNNRMTFPKFHSTPRTSEDFLNGIDQNFHVRETRLTAIPGLNFISSFPLDYMHLVCLGVMRTIMYIWIFASVPLKLQHRLISSISSNLLSLQAFIPSEFCRKPRSLDQIKRWKATEFRQFLLYTGPVVLQDVFLPDKEDLYNNFLTLHISLRILLSPKHCRQHQAYAKELLEHFVKTSKSVYGQQYITHNFHGLLHLADDVSTFGCLDTCSAFQFENFLQSMKKLVRKGDKPLQQVVKRLEEMSNSNVWFHNRSNSLQTQEFPNYILPHSSGPLIEGCVPSKQYKGIQFKSFKLTNSSPNSCCSLRDGSIVLILNVVLSSTLDCMMILCKQFMKVEDFYGYPLCQSSSLGIYEVSELSDVQMIPVCEISEKLVMLPLNANLKHVVMPLLHCD